MEFQRDVVRQIQTITDKANMKALVALLGKAVAALQHDPLASGGPRFRYHQLGLLHLVYPTEYFVLHYAIDEVRHVIYLRKLIMLNG